MSSFRSSHVVCLVKLHYCSSGFKGLNGPLMFCETREAVAKEMAMFDYGSGDEVALLTTKECNYDARHHSANELKNSILAER